jgi:hypothetical protein
MHDDGQRARTIERASGIQGVDAVLDGHLLRRWRHRLVGQTGPTEAQQVGLGAERQGILGTFHSRSTVGATPCSVASWLTDLVSFSNARTTWALNAAV